jgi:hypothetical protein
MGSQRKLLSFLTTSLRTARWKGLSGTGSRKNKREPTLPARRRPSGSPSTTASGRGDARKGGHSPAIPTRLPATVRGVESGHATAAERLSSTPDIAHRHIRTRPPKSAACTSISGNGQRPVRTALQACFADQSHLTPETGICQVTSRSIGIAHLWQDSVSSTSRKYDHSKCHH